MLTVLLAAALAMGVGVGTASAAGHQFRGHVDTTAVLGPVIVLEGHGIISRLGVVSMTGSQAADETGAVTGEATFVAANRDAVSFAWAHVPVTGLPGPVIGFGGDMTVTGGTGRFADRSGVVQFTGGFDLRTGLGWFDVSGSLG